jgi:hypothetical protein
MPNLVQRLKISEARQESWNKNGVGNKAFLAQKAGNGKFKGKKEQGKKPGNCFNCGKPGHWKSECRAPKKKQNARNTETESSNMARRRSQRKISKKARQGKQMRIVHSAALLLLMGILKVETMPREIATCGIVTAAQIHFYVDRENGSWSTLRSRYP